jgi:hypothetical protein
MYLLVLCVFVYVSSRLEVPAVLCLTPDEVMKNERNTEDRNPVCERP